MPKRIKGQGKRGDHFIRAWREFYGLTQQQLADHLNVAKASISRLESRQTPYTQDVLEALAKEFGTDPASLLCRNPRDPQGIWTIWETISPGDRARAIEVLKAFSRRTVAPEERAAPRGRQQ